MWASRPGPAEGGGISSWRPPAQGGFAATSGYGGRRSGRCGMAFSLATRRAFPYDSPPRAGAAQHPAELEAVARRRIRLSALPPAAYSSGVWRRAPVSWHARGARMRGRLRRRHRRAARTSIRVSRNRASVAVTSAAQECCRGWCVVKSPSAVTSAIWPAVLSSHYERGGCAQVSSRATIARKGAPGFELRSDHGGTWGELSRCTARMAA